MNNIVAQEMQLLTEAALSPLALTSAQFETDGECKVRFAFVYYGCEFAGYVVLGRTVLEYFVDGQQGAIRGRREMRFICSEAGDALRRRHVILTELRQAVADLAGRMRYCDGALSACLPREVAHA